MTGRHALPVPPQPAPVVWPFISRALVGLVVAVGAGYLAGWRQLARVVSADEFGIAVLVAGVLAVAVWVR